MKAFSLSLLRWLVVIGCTAAQDAFLHTLDIQPQTAPSSTSSSIDSETANALLARRLGTTGSRSLGPVDDVFLEHLNRYGGQRTLSLFGNDASSTEADRLILAIEGYDGEPLPASPSIRIERPDTNLASVSYMKDLVEQDTTGMSSCNGYIVSKGGIHITYLVDLKGGSCKKMDGIIRILGEYSDEPATWDPKSHLDSLQTARESGWRAFFKLDMTRMNTISEEERLSHIQVFFNSAHQLLASLAKEGGIESTILLLPSQRAPPILNLNRRQLPQAEEEEEPLSQPFVTVSSPASLGSSSETSTSNSTHSSAAPHTPLPACFRTQSICTESTNACSGRGSCYAKSSKCFTCRCKSTIARQDSDGKNVKTVQWGGSACERKDISVPFFLFAGFGVFMTALVVGSVGMLYSMGSEDLPSVIGAGVTGPRVQK